MSCQVASWFEVITRSVSPQKPSAAEPQPKPQALFHQRGKEFTEIGVFLYQELLTRCPPRLGGPMSDAESRVNAKTVVLKTGRPLPTTWQARCQTANRTGFAEATVMTTEFRR